MSPAWIMMALLVLATGVAGYRLGYLTAQIDRDIERILRRDDHGQEAETTVDPQERHLRAVTSTAEEEG